MHALLLGSAILAGMRFQSWRDHRAVLLVLVLAIFGSAVLALLARVRRRWHVIPVALALLLAVRYWMPLVVNHGQTWTLSETRAVAALRTLALVQEEHRLARGRYAGSTAELAPFGAGVGADLGAVLATGVEAGAWTLAASDSSGWSARVDAGPMACSMRVRASAGAAPALGTDGIPRCGDTARVAAAPDVVSADGADWNPRLEPFGAPALVGTWRQHRATPDRRADAPRPSTPVATWITQVTGPLRASPTVAGAQLFVAAHGNGEVAALHLESGVMGWRTRVPNWVHHDPVVDAERLFVTFGNSEFGTRIQWLTIGEEVGSPPSGVVALDRRTGRVRWSAVSVGSVMGAAARTSAGVLTMSVYGELVTRAPDDGAVRWRHRLPAGWSSPMSNPLVLDSLLVVAGDAGKWCVLAVADGARRFCRDEPGVVHGMGHSSPAGADGVVFQTGVGELQEGRDRWERWRCAVTVVLCSPTEPAREDVAVVIASELSTGVRRWAVRLVGPRHPTIGHFAGTPVVVADRIVVPLPRLGTVAALRRADGAVLWRADVRPSRGSVTVVGDQVFTATADSTFVVFDLGTGETRCRARLPGVSDRAGLTIGGSTGVLALSDGRVLARPVGEWMACRADWPASATIR